MFRIYCICLSEVYHLNKIRKKYWFIQGHVWGSLTPWCLNLEGAYWCNLSWKLPRWKKLSIILVRSCLSYFPMTRWDLPLSLSCLLFIGIIGEILHCTPWQRNLIIVSTDLYISIILSFSSLLWLLKLILFPITYYNNSYLNGKLKCHIDSNWWLQNQLAKVLSIFQN